jgi:cellulose biosynthesis protein BcsQ
VREYINRHLAVKGILFTMVQNTQVQRETIAAIMGQLGRQYHIYRHYIPRNTDLAAAAGLGRPAVISHPRSSGAQAYISLAHIAFPQTFPKEVGSAETTR